MRWYSLCTAQYKRFKQTVQQRPAMNPGNTAYFPTAPPVRSLHFPQHRAGLSLRPAALPLLQGPLLPTPAARHRGCPLPAGLAPAPRLAPPAPWSHLPVGAGVAAPMARVDFVPAEAAQLDPAWERRVGRKELGERAGEGKRKTQPSGGLPAADGPGWGGRSCPGTYFMMAALQSRAAARPKRKGG